MHADRDARLTPSRATLRRFRRLAKFARTHSAFYRELYADASRQPRIHDLPTVTKPELMARFDQWVTDPRASLTTVREYIADPSNTGVNLNGRYLVCITSGTTGEPGIFLADRRTVSVYRRLSLTRILFRWLRRRDVVALTKRNWRWAAVVGAGGPFAGAGWMRHESHRPLRSKQYSVVPVEQPIAQTVAALNEFDPGIITTYPSALPALVAEANAGRLRIHPTVIEVGGENISAALRAEAERAFGCAVRNVYATSEFLLIGADCRAGRMHVNSDWVILEPIDADGRAVADGVTSHSVLLTNLANHVQPLIRYDLGDSIRVAPGDCACGSRFPVIEVAGRATDELHFVGPTGEAVSIVPLSLVVVVEALCAEHKFQIVQTGPDELDIRIVDAPTELSVRVANAVRTQLASNGLRNVLVTATNVSKLEQGRSGKFRQAISQSRLEAR